MPSDDDHHTAAIYAEDDLDEEEEESDESDEEEQDPTSHNQPLEEEDVDLIDDDDDDEEDDSTSSAAGEVTIAVSGVPNTTPPLSLPPITQPDAIVEPKKPVDDSRRLFQRLWTDEDELELLHGFMEFTQRGTNNSAHHHDTTAFYDQIKGKLQLDFNKNQLVEKLRRLKKKYRNVLAKTGSGKEYVFKSAHDQATFELSCKIWNEPVAVSVPGFGGGVDDDLVQNHDPGFNLNEHNGNGIGEPNGSEKKVSRPRKRSRSSAVKIEENYSQQQQQQQYPVTNPVTTNLVEETVKSCLLPLFKELVNGSSNWAGGSSKGLVLGGMSVNLPVGDVSDEKWRKQHIMELEVYSKRLELMQDEVKSRLEELKSMGSL